MNKSVLILLGEGVELLEMSGFVDVMAWASFSPKIEINVVSASIHPTIQSAFGDLKIQASTQLCDLNLDRFDALAIPGGMEWAGFFNDAYSEEFQSTINYFHKRNKPIAAVCVASLSLAHAGVLKEQNAAIFHSKTGKHKAKLESYGAIFQDAPIVKSNNILTSTGPGTSVEIAFELLEMLCGSDIVSETRALMRIPHPTQNWYKPQVP